MSYIAHHYHIVFATKERRPFLTPDILPKLCPYMGGIARGVGAQIILCNGIENHIHMAAAIPATLCVADVVRDIKSNSSGWIHDTFPAASAFTWQDGYASITFDPTRLAGVKRYIAGQAEHHRKETFEEELIGILDRAGIQYDRRYVFA